jgi:hypothetical protein
MGCGLDIVFIDHSELRASTELLLISTIHNSPQHLLSLFQPAMSSPTVPRQQLLTVEILQLPTLTSFLHQLSYRTACQLSPPKLSIQLSAATAISSQLSLTADSQLILSWLGILVI